MAATEGVGPTLRPDGGVALAGGWAGTYQNDVTVGYDGPVTSCLDSTPVYGPPAKPAPNPPSANPDLAYGGTPTTGSYCSMSSPLKVAATNPGFQVGKTVQG